MDKIQELAFEQLHYDLVELRSGLKSELAELAPSIAKAVEKHDAVKNLDVTVTNPVKEFDGKVTVTNDLAINNLGELVNKLDEVIKSVEASKTEAVTITNPVVIKDLQELQNSLDLLLKKDTVVKVAAPEVNVTVPDEVKIANWPTAADKPLSVRLSNGRDFINQLQRIVSGGGSSLSAIGANGDPQPLNLDASGNLRVTSTGGGSTGGLTNTELRATPVPVDIGSASVTLNASDIQIGAVEIKDATSGDRTSVINTAPTTQFGLVTRNIPSGTQPVSGTFFQATQPVSLASQPLPTGAATSAGQLPNNHNVVVTSAPTTAVTGTFFQATQPVSGTVTANTGLTQPLTDMQLRATSLPVSGAFFQATQPVSAATLPLPTGAATSANQLPAGHAVAEATKTSLLPYAQLLNASTSITPSAGKRLEIVWVQVIPNSDNSSANLVTIAFNAGITLYRVYALGRSAVFTGATNQALNITLATGEPVTVNIQYREIT